MFNDEALDCLENDLNIETIFNDSFIESYKYDYEHYYGSALNID